MRHPWINLILFILLFVQIITGYLGLTGGDETFRWVLWLHGIGGYGLVVLLYWKSDIILYAIRRKKRWTWHRILFAFTGLLLLITLIFGIVWTVDGPIYFLGFSLVSLHIYVSVPLMLLMVWHAWQMRFVVRLPESRDRRLFLHSAFLGGAGLLLWRGLNWGKERWQLEGAKRRFTGSYEIGSLTGRFPSVSWIADYPEPIDLASYQLVIGGAVEQTITLDYAQLRQMATDRRTDTLDCTGGWYTTQVWTGVDLGRLLESAGVLPSGASVTVRAISGYQRRFSLDQAKGFMLALDVADGPLRHGHGAPLRLVATHERGVEWVKWVSEIRVNRTGKIWQMPLPIR